MQSITDGGEMVKYERPKVVDYGTLLQLTQAGTVVNSDVPHGNNNTAYPPS
jgi:hypothetical protein